MPKTSQIALRANNWGNQQKQPYNDRKQVEIVRTLWKERKMINNNT